VLLRPLQGAATKVGGSKETLSLAWNTELPALLGDSSWKLVGLKL